MKDRLSPDRLKAGFKRTVAAIRHPRETGRRQIDLEPYHNDILFTALRGFHEAYGFTPGVVYYPGSSVDTTLLRVPYLQNSRIIHLDSQPEVKKPLQQAGANEVRINDAGRFDPGPVDLLLLINFYHDRPVDFVKPEGFILAQSWGGPMEQLHERPDVELSGVIQVGDEPYDTYTVDTEHLDDYFTEVDTDEELQNRIMPYYFEKIQETVSSYFGDPTQLVARYRRLLDEGSRRFGGRVFLPDGSMGYELPKKKAGGFFVYKKSLTS